jgi:chromosome segregation ATPase
LPQEVAGLISVVAERYGYYFAKRVKSAERMQATLPERQKVAELDKAISEKDKAISEKVGEWMKNGTDTRAEITALVAEITPLQASLKDAKDARKEKGKEFSTKIGELTRALNYLDKILIPSQLQAVTGQPVVPKFTVSADILKAITKPAK